MLKIYWRRALHSSWMIAIVSVMIFAGVVAARILPVQIFASIAWLLCAAVLVFVALLKARVWAILFAVIGGGLLGIWRGSIELVQTDVYSQLYGKTVSIEGKILEDVDTNSRGQVVMRLGHLQINDHTIAGRMWVTSFSKREIQRSDKVEVYGKVQTGFGNFNAVMYGAVLKNVQHSEFADPALSVRNWFARGVTIATNEPQTSLGLGYLLGQRRGLPEELGTALKVAGLTHVVVASGYNLTILVRLCRRLFEKVSKYLSFITSSAMILGFIAITGMSPSMSRAGLVAGLSLLAWYYGRRFHPFVLLPLTIAITLLISPSYAWGDLGWQLSFAAFAGVMIVAPLANAFFFGDKMERPIGRILIETLSAQLCTLPIILLAFGQVSIVAPLANMLILPLVPLAMLLTFVAGLGAIVLPSFAPYIGMPAEILLSYMTQTILYFGKLPWALAEVRISALGAVGVYIAIACFAYYMWRKTKLNLGKTSLVE